MIKRYRKWMSWLFALLSVGAAAEARYLLIDNTNEDTMFLAAVAVTAILGGFWPGLLALTLSVGVALGDYSILYHDSEHPHWTLGIFIVEGILISGVCGLLHRSRRRERTLGREAAMLRDRVISISEAEQRRIGQDLHDGIGQQLTGIAFLSQSLARRLGKRNAEETDEAKRIAGMVSQTIGWTRDLARGLTPVAMEAGDLVAALRRLAESASSMCNVRCDVLPDERPLNLPADGAIHLYRIAQEAVNNALKHGQPSEVHIELRGGDHPELRISDNGAGIDCESAKRGGLGMEIMRYRAGLIGATLVVRKAAEGGTLVCCRLAGAREVMNV